MNAVCPVALPVYGRNSAGRRTRNQPVTGMISPQPAAVAGLRSACLTGKVRSTGCIAAGRSIRRGPPEVLG